MLTSSILRTFFFNEKSYPTLYAIYEIISRKIPRVINIRKVDKGDLILIIDFEQRKIIEEMNITKIAELCPNQSSNWEENRRFVDHKMTELYELDFVINESSIFLPVG